MPDTFATFADTVIAPSRAPYSVVPSDAVPLDPVPKALYVGGSGDIVLRGAAGTVDVTFRNVPAGATLDVRALFVRASGTTATALVALA